jgi:hypothetical protein
MKLLIKIKFPILRLGRHNPQLYKVVEDEVYIEINDLDLI